MKALFLFFLLLNAAYFYYQSEVQDDAAAPTILKQPVLPSGVDSLVLLRERFSVGFLFAAFAGRPDADRYYA